MLTKAQIRNALNFYISSKREKQQRVKPSDNVTIEVNHSLKIIKSWDNIYIINNGEVVLQTIPYPETYSLRLPKEVYEFLKSVLKNSETLAKV
ncbi:hypothetical protein U8V72_23030 [Priestia filamentosa]|uniref:hypothetical protein n=1 Tax=Priestia filamentosa TaxID=1402861 RepID=UPI000588F970